MAQIALLNQETIDKIAAGEVIERPSSVVKELVENSIDAGATAITVEIKEGGISLIRITDNGCGIEKDQVSLAFLRHSTSKIKSVEDLLTVSSLGFRGEALSSISAVAQVELITKTVPDLTGIRYVIEGSVEKEKEEIGAPDGTTFLVRNLFYNTPARRKFLKTPQTEAGYINALVERLALSHPDISFKLIVNNQTKLHTSGNSNAKDVIYQIYGREITSSLIEVNEKNDLFEVKGFIGKPIVSRGNRNFENYFINQRYIKSSLIAKAIEDAYKNFLMQHQYPFCVLYFTFAGELLDVNVHPTKMELRFTRNEEIYHQLYECIRERLVHRDHINDVSLEEKKDKKIVPAKEKLPEPFEKNRLAKSRIASKTFVQNPSDSEAIKKEQLEKLAAAVRKDSPYEPKYTKPAYTSAGAVSENVGYMREQESVKPRTVQEQNPQMALQSQKSEELHRNPAAQGQPKIQIVPENQQQQDMQAVRKTQQHQENNIQYVQEELQYEGKFLSEQARKQHKIIGQVFDTYWLVEYDEKFFIIDQHAAHEKVLYEKTVRSLKDKEYTSQLISPPIILTLDNQEEQALQALKEQLNHLGFEIEHFGGKEYSICVVPGNLFNLDARQILIEILDSADEIQKASTPDTMLDKIASMSCKAAVKGNHALKLQEVETLISELLELENPYFCPHGRPTIISMSKYELEKKFNRIV